MATKIERVRPFDFLMCILIGFLCLFLEGCLFGGSVHASSCSVGMSTSDVIILDLVAGQPGVVTSDLVIDTDCIAGYNVYIEGPEDSTLYLDGDSASENYIVTVAGTEDNPIQL